jgi:hypothetical protein
LTDQDSEVCVISGTRRKVQELADGTLRVLVDIDPRFKADFHRLFPSIDTPCALAPLALDFEKLSKYPEEQKGGELARLAGIWCKNPDFQQWLSKKHPGHSFNEGDAADWIRKTCRVNSRAELDSSSNAGWAFHTQVRGPFMEYMKL